MGSLSTLPADPYPGQGNGPYRLMRLFAIGPLLALAASLRDPKAAQQARLDRILKEAAGSDFGKSHQLRPTMSLQEWREAVPIRRHAELLPWLERVANGEKNVLFSSP
ncbi:MAG TPA: GH3 auxin-responsive promoter family protein, partial [Myxococcota bacterium]|nr:GH3 auxin-responsive promoter family protein [Myxococcota bacterium]